MFVRLLALAVMLTALPPLAHAGHDDVVLIQREIADIVGEARDELRAVSELVDAADSSAVRREIRRKTNRIDELLARLPRLTAELESAAGGRGVAGTSSNLGGTTAGVGVSVGGLGAGVVVVVDDHDTAPAPVVVVEERHDDGPYACSESDFASVLRAVEDESFSSGKLERLKDASMDRWYTSDQVKRMLGKFSFDNDKVEAAVVMHPRVIDLENWFKVHDAFSFDSSKEELRRRVGR